MNMTTTETVRRVGILAPMKPELLPVVKAMKLERGKIGAIPVSVGKVGNVDVIAVMTGIGMGPATKVTEQLLDSTEIDHVIVVGIAGGVVPNVKLGDLVVPEIVVDERTGKEYRPTPLDGAIGRGTIHSSDELLVDEAEITRRSECGIFALDMETGAVAAVCEARGVPWSTYRGISDLAGDSAIDPEIMKLAGPDGSGNLPAVARYLLQKPSRITGLLHLAKGMRAATTLAANAAKRACESVKPA